jgi:hypothetical protein
MTDDRLDLRDHRGRLIRLGIAAAVALVVTIVVIRWIDGVSPAPNADPVGASAVPLLAIAMFVVITLFVVGVLARVSRRRA